MFCGLSELIQGRVDSDDLYRPTDSNVELNNGGRNNITELDNSPHVPYLREADCRFNDEPHWMERRTEVDDYSDRTLDTTDFRSVKDLLDQ